ncbi:sodium:alanine symporter family protein [Adlercreutzia sp. ZJ154]|uniref:alanine/glycine:cation symporter family protein n=1 Tax=Adlercreutzia sp. ZJ154 TaxID=2709790 RepID=UPI0013EA094B|nr:alanine/glycine:cation symporter family protein [Adlercreutzia sp. ZJ154]
MDTASVSSFLVSLTGDINSFMYTYILVILLVFTGVYFTIRTRFVQLRYIKDMLTQLSEKRVDAGGKAISSFQAMMVSTGSRVGTGNIAGIATALAIGGPGALFWMWAMALIGAASAFVESTLAQIWKVKVGDGEFRGGPAYYMQQGLGKRWMGVMFAVSLIACYAIGFNELQAYNAASALEYYIPDYSTNGAAVIMGVVLTALTAVVIFGGAKRISVINSVVVPIMALAYIALGIWVTLSNVGLLPQAFSLMFSSAFDFQAIFGGFAGSAVMLGIKRGLFSNEAGMGSAPNAAATASVSHPVKQGLVQTLSVYIDTMFICTCSAMLVLVFMVQNPQAASGLNGMPLVQMAVYQFAGNIGIAFITVAVFLFAYTSLIGNYFYAESNLKFIFGEKKRLIFWFRIACLVVIFAGCLSSFDLAWNIADILMGIMCIINLVGILLLGKWAIRCLDDYARQRKAGVNPVFNVSSIPGMPACECWNNTDNRHTAGRTTTGESKFPIMQQNGAASLVSDGLREL